MKPSTLLAVLGFITTGACLLKHNIRSSYRPNSPDETLDEQKLFREDANLTSHQIIHFAGLIGHIEDVQFQIVKLVPEVRSQFGISIEAWRVLGSVQDWRDLFLYQWDNASLAHRRAALALVRTSDDSHVRALLARANATFMLLEEFLKFHGSEAVVNELNLISSLSEEINGNTLLPSNIDEMPPRPKVDIKDPLAH